MMKVLESLYIIIFEKLIDDFYIDYLQVVKVGSGGGGGGGGGDHNHGDIVPGTHQPCKCNWTEMRDLVHKQNLTQHEQQK